VIESIKDIRYAIRYKGKYFRYDPTTISADKWQWITGLSRADISDLTTCKYRMKKFGIDYAEIVSIEVGDYNYKTITSRDRKVVKIITCDEILPDDDPTIKTLKRWDIVLPGRNVVKIL